MKISSLKVNDHLCTNLRNILHLSRIWGSSSSLTFAARQTAPPVTSLSIAEHQTASAPTIMSSGVAAHQQISTIAGKEIKL